MKVLIAYDGSSYADIAIADLDTVGLPLDTQARILSVVDRHIQAPVMDSASERVCDDLQRRFSKWDVQMETAAGHPAEMILKRSTEWHADLIVMGTHGRPPLSRWVLGSVSAAVARDASCSVRIARAAEFQREGPPKLLIAVDGSSQADRAIAEVCSRSWPAGTEVRVICVIEALVATRADQMAGIADSVQGINKEEQRWLEYLVHESEQKLLKSGLRVSSLVMVGSPRESLVNEARDSHVDTIFMGARGRGLIERLLMGSVSAAVIHHAPCTVEVVRG